MRSIQKGHEPGTLTRHRNSAHADYENYAAKDTLRVSLVTEQRGLCCYCLSRIRANAQAMKIAHWHSQDRYPAEQLDYQNLLGACKEMRGSAKVRSIVTLGREIEISHEILQTQRTGSRI